MIKKILQKFLPSTTRVIYRGSQEPEVLAHLLDVDRLHSALRSAEAGNTVELFAIYRDMIGSHSHLQGEFSKRKLAVLGDLFNLTPKDPEDEHQVAHVEAVKEHLESIKDWIFRLGHMMDSTLYPVAVMERLYRESNREGWRYELANLVPVPHHHLTWDDGVLSLRDTSKEGHFLGTSSPLQLTDYIVHRGHLLTSLPDWHGGPMRAVLFWWFFSVAGRDWWARFLDRFGSPFMVGKYDPNDDSAKYDLASAFQAAQRIFGITVSNNVEVEMLQANSTGGGDAFEKFHAVANREISKIVVGQTLSAEGQNLGLGGGQAAAQGQVRDDIRQFDAAMLSHTIKTQILVPLWRLNGWTTPMPSVSFGASSTDEQEVTGKLLASLSQGGLRITDEGLSDLSKKLGFPIERVPQQVPVSFAALSAEDKQIERLPLIPSAARRLERKRQARGATEAMLAAASPRLAKLMREDYAKFEQAIEESTSPDDALERIAVLTANYDASEVSELIQHTLTSASVNALIAGDR